MRVLLPLVLAGILLLLVQPGAHGCPSCYGDPESPMTQGLNTAIVLLLGVTSAVLVGLSGIFFVIRRRTQQISRRLENLLN
jgi:hypothetical protein